MFGRNRRLTDLLTDRVFVKKVCEKASFASLDEVVIDALILDCLEEANKFAFRKDQLFNKFTDGIKLISNVEVVRDKVQFVYDEVEQKSREWSLHTIPLGVHNIACGVVAAYYVQALIDSDQYLEEE